MTVISVVGLLVALMFPAIQQVRESARQISCRSNLKQIALANENYAVANRSYVLGRDGIEQWAVSWAFRLLPFLELQAQYDSHNYAAKCYDPVNEHSMRIAVEHYTCPARRGPAADRDFDNHSSRPIVLGVGTRGGYAGNAGLTWEPDEIYAWDHSFPDFERVGPILTSRAIFPRHVTGGTSNTWLVGEKHIPTLPEAFHNRDYRSGDMAFLAGDHPWTVQRVAQNGLAGDPRDLDITKFGSPHPQIVFFCFLDGHVESRAVDSDPVILEREATIGAE